MTIAQRLGRAGLSVYLGLKALISPVAFGVSAIVDDDAGQVLLVRHSYQPGWHLPGGGVGAAEPPALAILRELKEEVGLLESAPPELVGVFTRRLGWVTNVIALYRVTHARIAFEPNAEIREIQWADPRALPEGTVRGARRRLAEFADRTAPEPYW
ncbi:MAG TPA: NUDIX domain-containing protein [Rhizomicrobium sp.]|nr:NUDIX domain-containing protein [Rhizomicrobium sp.]